MNEPVLIDTDGIYNFVKYDGRIVGLPRAFGPFDFGRDTSDGKPGFIHADTLWEARRRAALAGVGGAPVRLVPMLSTPANIRFYGSNHPAYAPIFASEYATVQIAPPPEKADPTTENLRALDSALQAFRKKMSDLGIDRDAVESFIDTRDLQSLLIIAAHTGVHFFQGLPLHIGARPWVIQIENPRTMFLPYVTSDSSFGFTPQGSPIWKIVRALLLADECLGIITNLTCAIDSLPALLESEEIAAKAYHLPFCVPPAARKGRKTGKRFLFTTSWHQHERSFYFRGGADALAIFAALSRSHPDLELVVRAKLPSDLSPDLAAIARAPNVRIVDDVISRDEMDGLFADADFYLLPSAGLHSMSTIEAMAQGCICLLADAWGNDEYLLNGNNGLRISGREGRNWEYRAAQGYLAQRQDGLERPDPDFVRQAVDAIGPLIANPAAREQMAERARRYAAEKHSIEEGRKTFSDIMRSVRARAHSISIT